VVWRAIFTRRIMYAVAFAVVFGTACFFLGRWQLSRYEDKDARANAVEQNYHAAAVPLLSVLPTASTPLPEERIWTPVTVTGQYAASGQLLVRGRALNTAQGMEVLVPFRVDGGAILLVDRGWVPNGDQAADLPTVPPAPAGSVTLTGWLKPSEEAREKGLPAGQLATINLEQAQAQIDGRLYAAYLVLGSESLGAGQQAPPRPAALEPPTPDRGPHFAYALQWWLTALLGAAFVVYLYRHPPGEPVARVKDPAPKKVRIWDEEDG
jgi:cytochrome oxidase assembly protein ShyY1